VSYRLRQWLKATLAPLDPLFRHAVKVCLSSAIVRGTSELLHLILPAHYAVPIEKIEILFYLAVTATFSIYAFLLLLWHLGCHCAEEIVLNYQKTIKAISASLHGIPSSHSLPKLEGLIEQDILEERGKCDP
jgi:hypothetical protein